MDMTEWAWGFAGGLMIGCAAAMHLLLNGRIMGASSIFAALLVGDEGGRKVVAAFLVGLVACPALIAALSGGAATHLTTNPAVIIIAGLLVGLGTRMARGCTSGHGVCGISRLAPRGLAATGIYLAAGMVTMAIARHALGVI